MAKEMSVYSSQQGQVGTVNVNVNVNDIGGLEQAKLKRNRESSSPWRSACWSKHDNNN